MNRLMKQLFFFILTINSTLIFSKESTATTITLPPNLPVILTNSSNKPINVLCIVYVASQQAILIKIINGSGSFNGTTFQSGFTLIESFYNTQSVAVQATTNTKAQVTNLGPYEIKAIC